MNSMNDSLLPHRQRIDAIDAQVIALLNERLGEAASIGRIKKESGAAIYVPEREEEVLRKVQSHNAGPLPEKALRAIYREIMSAAIALEKTTTIAYLGPAATFTHQAAMAKFGASLEYRAYSSISDVFSAVERKDADYGVIPIENSTEGAVFHSLDTLVDSDLKIVSQVYLPIEHCLLSEGSLADITEVCSKDQAIGQCRGWLQINLPKARLTDTASTAHAVQLVKNRPQAAAIASALAGEMHGVPLVARGIQDKSDNITRFLVVGRNASPVKGGGENKTSLVISINDEVGALQKAIEPFSSRRINLCKIESRPSRKRPWDYYFFIDIIGHHEDADVQAALSELRRFCPLVKWLGSYPNAT